MTIPDLKFRYMHRSGAGTPGCWMQMFMSAWHLAEYMNKHPFTLVVDIIPTAHEAFHAVITKQLSDEDIEELQELQAVYDAGLAARRAEREKAKRNAAEAQLTLKADVLAAMDVGRMAMKANPKYVREHEVLAAKHLAKLTGDLETPVPDVPGVSDGTP